MRHRMLWRCALPRGCSSAMQDAMPEPDADKRPPAPPPASPSDSAGGVLSDMAKLTTLDMSRNGLELLPRGMLSGLAKLRTLLLDGNRITSIDADAFADTVGTRTPASGNGCGRRSRGIAVLG